MFCRANVIAACAIWFSAVSAFAQPNTVDVYDPINVQRGAFNSKAPGTVTPGGHAQEVFLGRVPFSGAESPMNAPDPVLQTTPSPRASVSFREEGSSGARTGFSQGFHCAVCAARYEHGHQPDSYRAMGECVVWYL